MIEIVIGVLSSFIATSLFLLCLRALRPVFEISKEIAFMNENGKDKFSIKILNKSPRNAINIRIEIGLMSSKIVPNGTILSRKAVSLRTANMMVLSRFDKKDTDATYAYRINIIDDINTLWTDETNQFIRVKIFAQDEMSNFGRVFIQDYMTKRNSLKHGQFSFGDSHEIT